MRIVVDTNIVFSALINSKSTIPEMIIVPFSEFKFFTSEYLFKELENHKNKLQKASKLTEEEIIRARTELFKYIKVISHELIPQEIWHIAEDLTFDIDPDDIPFVALSIFLDAYLWTGDKELYAGLKKKRFNNVFLTSELREMLQLVACMRFIKILIFARYFWVGVIS